MGRAVTDYSYSDEMVPMLCFCLFVCCFFLLLWEWDIARDKGDGGRERSGTGVHGVKLTESQ